MTQMHTTRARKAGARINMLGLALGATALTALAGTASADNVINDDLIVTSSACIGFDCVNGENFGFDTLRLKENNLRLHFDDTSNSSSFPSNDWRFVANDSSNGGASYLAIEDATAGRQVFRVIAGAPANAMYIDAQGDVGLGTSNPVVELHIANGDSPTLRLEQNGSSGFTPQTWDLAGNEANFFVRDVTNGSKLPFKIVPGAPTNSLYVAADGDIGLGTASPSGALDILRSSGAIEVKLDNRDTNASVTVWKLSHSGSDFRILNQDTAGTTEFSIDADGNVATLGNLFAGSLSSCPLDAPILADGSGGLKC